jgi:hypothetical protein
VKSSQKSPIAGESFYFSLEKTAYRRIYRRSGPNQMVSFKDLSTFLTFFYIAGLETLPIQMRQLLVLLALLFVPCFLSAQINYTELYDDLDYAKFMLQIGAGLKTDLHFRTEVPLSIELPTC